MGILIHWSFEMLGSGCWACVRGRCTHRHHRVVGDAALTLFLAVMTVRIVG